MGISLELRKKPDGTLRQNWYGVHVASGKRRVVSLNLWKGNPPASMISSDTGDAEFERSRGVALDVARKVFEEDTSAAEKETLARSFYRARYRQMVKVQRLSDLQDIWREIPKKRDPSAGQTAGMLRNLDRFARFMEAHFPKVKELPAVTPDHIRAFVNALPEIAGSGRSCNAHLNVLRRVFRAAAPESIATSYLIAMPGFEEKVVHRVPFTDDELREILVAAKSDPILYPLVVCAATTAMRRKDIALLRWKSVNLHDGFITVSAAKTGEVADIPILPMLHDVLVTAKSELERDPSAFVWPDAARMYLTKTDAMDKRLKVILAQAGFVTPAMAAKAARSFPSAAPDETLARGLRAIDDAVGWTQKRRTRAREILRRYVDGATVGEIADAMRSSKAIVSMHLSDIEGAAHLTIIRRDKTPGIIKSLVVDTTGEDGHRKLRGSLRGWHSFKTTFITMALNAGIPREVVMRVCGNKAVDIVLKHYFRPDRAAIRAAMLNGLPSQLTAK